MNAATLLRKLRKHRNILSDDGPPVIYHITSKTDWDTALAAGSYTADSLYTEGYIHCSTAEQVIVTANRLFRGKHDLVLLCVETSRVNAEILYENLEGGTNLFPHVYGALEITSILAVHDFPPQEDGCFELPPALKPSSDDLETGIGTLS